MLEIFVIMFAYLLGSIPFGLILSTALGKGDLRKKGSGNIGATNAMRVGGKLLGLLTLTCDILKGIIPMMLAEKLFPNQLWIIGFTGFSTVLGHIFPIFLKFKGGKGIATTLAVVFIMNYLLGLFALSVWLITYGLTRISSLSSLIMILGVTIIGYFMLPFEYATILAGLCLITTIRHKSNIERLLKGKEDKL